MLSKRRFWVGLFVIQILLFYLFSRWSVTVYFVDFLFEQKKYLFQSLFSKIPFSLGDIFYFVLGLLLVFSLFKIFNSKTRKVYSLRLLKGLNVFYFVYQLVWGMTYFQRPIVLALDEKEPQITEIKALALKYLHQAKHTRTLVKEDEKGVFQIQDLEKIKREILSQQKRIPAFLGNKISTEIDNFKPSLYSGFMNYTGVLGYYNPFSTEAQYNSHLPHTYLLFTLSHESAHQLGFAREQEANFVGYLVGISSENPELRYSTEYFALKSLLRALVTEDEDFVKMAIEQYSDEMKRDYQAEKDFVEEYQGPMNTFFAFTNDLFLKTNQQEGAVTYSYFVDLLVRYERMNHDK
jgi:hypothetical protein